MYIAIFHLKKKEILRYMIEIEPGGIYYSGSHGEKTTEYIILIEGTLKLKVRQHDLYSTF